MCLRKQSWIVFSSSPPPSGFTIPQYSQCKHYSSGLYAEASLKEREREIGLMGVFVSSIQPSFCFSDLTGVYFTLWVHGVLKETALKSPPPLGQNKMKGSRKDPVSKPRYCQWSIYMFILFIMTPQLLLSCLSSCLRDHQMRMGHGHGFRGLFSRPFMGG